MMLSRNYVCRTNHIEQHRSRHLSTRGSEPDSRMVLLVQMEFEELPDDWTPEQDTMTAETPETLASHAEERVRTHACPRTEGDAHRAQSVAETLLILPTHADHGASRCITDKSFG